MTYDFLTLSPADFEDLARDLVSAELGIRLEGFGPGPDGGVDGRHATDGGDLILQAKHRAGSSYPSLKSAMRKERKSIDRLKPARYILVTSQSLTPNRKDALAKIIGPALKNTGDILGRTELNAILRQYPAIERSHIKLWLSSASVLDRFLRSAAFSYTATSRDEMLDKLRVYAPNPSFGAARDILEKHHALIVSGPPGVGKTTLAQMLTYAYVGEEWEFIAIRQLDDGFAAIQDVKRQIFFFDDFLGKIALDRRALATKDTEFARFILRVQKSKNARFILTTRAYIYEEARRVSETLGDRRLDATKYVLNVGVYTRRVRARILYNHLIVSSLPTDYALALVTGDGLPRIIDHKNYNPRVIEWMTDASLLKDVSSDAYADHFLNMLDHPIEIWDRAFREHIPPKAQHLLISLFFCSQYGEDLDDLRLAFDAVHVQLCKKHRITSRPTDFQDSLKILEGSFLSLHGRKAFFVNPSVRDYLDEYLSDAHLLADLAPVAQSAEWAQAVWQCYKSLDPPVAVAPGQFAELFSNIAGRFNSLRTWRESVDGPHVRTPHDLAFTDRITLLEDWRKTSGSDVFVDALHAIVTDPADNFSGWRDGPYLPDLVSAFRSGTSKMVSGSAEIADKLEQHLVNLLKQMTLSSDELDRIRQDIEDASDEFSEELGDALLDAIISEIDEASSIVRQFDSITEVADHAENIKRLADWAGIDPSSALSSFEYRLEELDDEGVESKGPSFPSRTVSERDEFDDAALRSLFETLAM